MGTVETGSAKNLADDSAFTVGEKSEDVKVEPEGAVVGDDGKFEGLGGLVDVVIEDGGAGDGGKGAGLGLGNGEGNGDGRVVLSVDRDRGEGEGMVKGVIGESAGVVLGSDASLEQGDGIKQNGGSSGDDGKVEEMIEEEDGDGEGDDGDPGRKFDVGDFVWGKSKSHPFWWPGVVYDENDASEVAAQKKSSNRLLVGYFGDGTFSWCSPSRLKPFGDNLEELSKTSQSKNFVNALEETADVIGRLVELEFNRSLPEEKRRGLDTPLGNNTGVKEDVLVPVSGIRRSSFIQYEPKTLLADIVRLATDSSRLTMLKLTILKSFLSAFYHAKGGYQLLSFTTPQPILGLEDKTEQGGIDEHVYGHNADTAATGPSIEDWHSSPSQSAVNKLAATADGKLEQQRKEKSIADILRVNTDGQASNTSSTGRRKRKAGDVSDVQIGTSSSSKTKRRKTMPRRAPNVDGVAGVDVDQAIDQSKEESDDGSMSSKKTMIRVLNVTSEDGEASEQTGRGSHSRERKKSKYLSPPFTSFSPLRKKVLQAESIRNSSKARVSEEMTAVANSPKNGSPALKNVSETGERNLAEENANKSSSYPTTPRQMDRTVNPMTFQVSANEVLSGVMSAACDPINVGHGKDVSAIKEYLSAFRKIVYSNEPIKKVQKSRASQKRKAPDTATEEGTDGHVVKKSLLQDDVVKEKFNLISSMLDLLDGDNALELKPKLIAEFGAIKERVAA